MSTTQRIVIKYYSHHPEQNDKSESVCIPNIMMITANCRVSGIAFTVLPCTGHHSPVVLGFSWHPAMYQWVVMREVNAMSVEL